MTTVYVCINEFGTYWCLKKNLLISSLFSYVTYQSATAEMLLRIELFRKECLSDNSAASLKK